MAFAEGLGIGERAAHDAGVRHGLQPVGKGKHAALGEQAHLHQILALQALGDGAVAIDLGAPRLARAPGDELDRGHVVDDRLGIRQADHAGDAAGRRRLGAAGDGLHMLLARLAQLDAHVDQPRRQALMLAADDLGAFRQAVAAHRRPDLGDAPVDGEKPAQFFPAAGRIQQPRAEQGEGAPSGCHRRRHSREAGASARRGRPCARQRPSRPARGSGCGRCRRRPRNRSPRRGSSARDA